MNHKKNLSAKDLSEKFGIPVTEGDMNPDFEKDNEFLSRMADLSKFASELEQKKTPAETAQELPDPEKEKTFAELFEEKSRHVDTESRPKKPTPKQKKIVDVDDDMDFEKLFKASSMKVFDKDEIAIPDKDYEPFEINEEDVKAAGKTEFHGFDDFANAFGSKKRHKK